jgi:hypothetical protein
MDYDGVGDRVVYYHQPDRIARIATTGAGSGSDPATPGFERAD